MASKPRKSKEVDVEEDIPAEEETAEEAEEVEEEESAAPAAKKAAKGDVIFVNKEKLSRATDIVALVAGKRTVRDSAELDRKEHFAQMLAANGVKALDKNAVQTIYELLGGLVRTPGEQAQADKKAAELKTKLKKKKVQ